MKYFQSGLRRLRDSVVVLETERDAVLRRDIARRLHHLHRPVDALGNGEITFRQGSGEDAQMRRAEHVGNRDPFPDVVEHRGTRGLVWLHHAGAARRAGERQAVLERQMPQSRKVCGIGRLQPVHRHIHGSHSKFHALQDEVLHAHPARLQVIVIRVGAATRQEPGLPGRGFGCCCAVRAPRPRQACSGHGHGSCGLKKLPATHHGVHPPSRMSGWFPCCRVPL